MIFLLKIVNTAQISRPLHFGVRWAALVTMILFPYPILAVPAVSVSNVGGARPVGGIIPSAKVAGEVAEAVLIPIYGIDKIRAQRPYRAKLVNDVWEVTGTSHLNIFSPQFGGTFTIRISKTTGEILYIIHGK